jgi:hypothetical protein
VKTTLTSSHEGRNTGKPPSRPRHRLGKASSDQLGGMRTMFAAYWIFILAVFAFFFYAGLADR